MELVESTNCTGSATFHPGSICNLACVTCGPEASTRWQQELKIPIVPGNAREIDQMIVQKARAMTGVIICGGEPMLNRSSETMLENLRSEQNVRVHFNGTVLPSQSFLEKSHRFQNLNYCFSLDGTQERFEYLRWPAKWSKVVENIIWLRDHAPANVRFAVVITVSQLNRDYYQEVVDWVGEVIPQNRQGVPTVINFNQAGDGLLNVDYLDRLDSKRNLNWRSLFPKSIDNILC